MTKIVKYKDEMLGWQRKAGPLRIWRVIEARSKADDGKINRFSIQEIPENRYEEVMDLMCSVFIRDEPICRNLKAIDDPLAIEDFCKLWSLALQKGIVVGAFLIDEGDRISTLAGVNMTVVACDITEKTLHTGIEFRSEGASKLLAFMNELEAEKNVRKDYNVDELLVAYGLCIDPRFRRQGLGFHLLDARHEMSVAYGIKATSTVFTSSTAQRNAARSGFEVLVEHDFIDVKDEDGNERFPGILEKSVKLMGKRF